ncbi:MAG TPA: hypothetical protein VN937_05790 [Blastocatellia bacterium]|nr:hypothetical protein [Blastocatellia bacterium]
MISPSTPTPDYGQFDLNRLEAFLARFLTPTQHLAFGRRCEELDKRIREAELSLADKIESIKRLAPAADATDRREELRMERLILSVAPEELSLFKFALEYDGDYKDLVEYVFNDIDDTERRGRIVEHFRLAPAQVGIKVLTDVDDTMYANLIETRYPRKTLYPGVLEFYDSIRHEPFEASPVPITTLSARPNPIAGKLEERSLTSLVSFTKGILRPSALSGALTSAVKGTLQTVLRADQEHLDLLSNHVPHGQEDEIGRVKFSNFLKFAEVYPEYRFVFIGDAGQADALTAQLMVTQNSTETSRVLTTFIHDIRESENDAFSASTSFASLLQHPDLLVSETSASGRGVIVFRNYIHAAVIAYRQSATLENLVTAEELATITRAALEQFQEVVESNKDRAFERLRQEYRQDAESAYQLLMTADPKPSALEDIRRLLDEGF